MRRIALTVAFFAPLTIAVFALMAAPAQAAPARVVRTECEPDNRAAEFEARMGEVAGAASAKKAMTTAMRRMELP